MREGRGNSDSIVEEGGGKGSLSMQSMREKRGGGEEER